MGMIYLCDVGNTRTKIAKVFGSEISMHRVLSGKDKDTLFDLPDFGSDDQIYVAHVGRLPIPNQAKTDKCSIINISHIPAEWIDYNTPETLGIDRVLAGFGAYSSNKKSVVVVDSGSATTIDVIDNEGRFQGGVIAPGLEAIHGGMHEKTPLLPKVSFTIPTNFPGKNSAECIQLGTNQFFLDAVSAAINRSILAYPESQIFLSGGNSKFIADNIPKAMVDDLLVFKGMLYCIENGWFGELNSSSI